MLSLTVAGTDIQQIRLDQIMSIQKYGRVRFSKTKSKVVRENKRQVPRVATCSEVDVGTLI